jgi:prolyl-tRNA synthetase
MRPRVFLRTAEFLWQEGHTVHATSAEAVEETMKMLEVYADFAENVMAMPVIKGEKTPAERFPGAVSTYCIEAVMQDRKALQAGTSHFLGQNFAHASNIQFLSAEGKQEFAWTTSWGVSTRLIGALIMVHSDDDGLVLPPRLAPKHVVLMPIYRDDAERTRVLDYCHRLSRELRDVPYFDRKILVELDDRDIRGGDKAWQHIKRGVPLRVEVGPRDIDQDAVFVGRRDRGPKEKTSMPRVQFLAEIASILDDMQQSLYQRAIALRESVQRPIDTLAEFEAFFTPQNADKPEIHGGLALSHWADDPVVEAKLKEMKVTARCIPLAGDDEPGKCIFTGKPSSRRVVFAKAY